VGRMSCMVEALLNFSLRIGFLMEPLRINEIGQQEIVYNLFLFRCIHPHSSTSLLMRTSCSSVGAFLWDFTIALVLHTCDARSNGPKKKKWKPFIQAHNLGGGADCAGGTLPWKLRQLLDDYTVDSSPAVVHGKKYDRHFSPSQQCCFRAAFATVDGSARRRPSQYSHYRC